MVNAYVVRGSRQKLYRGDKDEAMSKYSMPNIVRRFGGTAACKGIKQILASEIETIQAAILPALG